MGANAIGLCAASFMVDKRYKEGWTGVEELKKAVRGSKAGLRHLEPAVAKLISVKSALTRPLCFLRIKACIKRTTA
jgi:hypothetical protein